MSKESKPPLSLSGPYPRGLFKDIVEWQKFSMFQFIELADFACKNLFNHEKGLNLVLELFGWNDHYATPRVQDSYHV